MCKSCLLILFLFYSYFIYGQCDIDFDLTVNTPTCYNFSDGSISITITEGTPPYDVQITNSDGDLVSTEDSPFANTLAEGSYTVLISYGVDCDTSFSIHLDAPDELDIDYTVFNCEGECDGRIMVDTVYNFNGSYLEVGYYWSPNPTGMNGVGANELIDLCGGDYILTINDQFGCTANFSLEVSCPSGINENMETNYSIVVDEDGINYTVDEELIDGVIHLFSMSGNLIYEEKIQSSSNHLNLNLNSGNYILTIHTSNGLSISEKIFLQY